MAMFVDEVKRLGSLLDSPGMEARWKAIIIAVSLLHTSFESCLTLRQKSVLSRRQPPPVLAREITQDAFDKSQAYGRAKANFSLWSGAYGQVCNALFVSFDMLPRLWAFAGAVIESDVVPDRFSGEKSQSVVFLLALMQVQQFIGLFPAWYSTFRLEEAFGFNKQTLGLWVTDLFKSNMLIGLMVPPILAGFLAIVQRTGNWFFFFVWLFIAVLQAFMITIYPIFILPLFNKLSPVETGKLKDSIDKLAKKLAFPLDEMYVIDGSKRSSHSNAYFFGMPWKKHIVLYDTLLEQSDNEEIVAVLAHELGHWKLGHTTRLFALSQAQVLYIFICFSAFIDNASLYKAFGFATQRPIIVGLILFLDILTPMDLVIKWTMNGISRRFEFEADHFAHGLGHAKELSRALIKLQIKNLSTMDADKWYARYNFSHPHLTERLGQLGWKPDASEKPVSEVLAEKIKEKEEREKKEKEEGRATTTGRDEL